MNHSTPSLSICAHMRHTVSYVILATAILLSLVTTSSAEIIVTGSCSPDESTWTTGGDANSSGIVGWVGEGEVRVDAGSTVTFDDASQGQATGITGTVTVTGAGSKFTADDRFVGENGTGYLTVEDGGLVSNGDGYLGYNPGSAGYATVDGADSQWTNSDIFVIGDEGTGELTISNGGYASSTNYTTVGRFENASGTVTVTGAGSTLDAGENFEIGAEGTGRVTIKNGGTATCDYGIVGIWEGGEGSVTVNGSGSQWSFGPQGFIGYESHGNLLVQNGGTVTGDGTLYIGLYGNGSMTIESAGVVNTAVGRIGMENGGVGDVTIRGAGSQWNNSENLYIGHYGTGELTISDGGYAGTTGPATIGVATNSSGTVTVTGSGSWLEAGGDIDIGGDGTGRLVISDGGTVTCNSGYIGVGESGTGYVTVEGTGSQWHADGRLFIGCGGQGNLLVQTGGSVNSDGDISVGNQGNGTVNLLDGGTINVGLESYIGNSIGATGTVNVTGGTWNGKHSINVGNSDSTAKLNISEGGRVNMDWDVNIHSGGTVNIMVDGDGMLNAGVNGSNGWGEFTNNGVINLLAAGKLAAGSYTPLTKAADCGFYNNGEINAIGGTWNEATYQFEVSEIEDAGDGTIIGETLSARRIRFFDSLLVSFAEGVGEETFTVEENSLDTINGESVLAAYDFDTTISSLTLLTFLLNDDYDENIFNIWYLADGETEWTLFVPDIVDYTNHELAFTVSSFSSYAVTVPEPATLAVLGLGFMVVTLKRRRR